MPDEVAARSAAETVRGFLAEPDDERFDPDAALRHELLSLWADLEQARRYAINRTWSRDCARLVHRISRLTLIVGSPSWEEIDISLLETGIYQAVHEALAVDYEAPDMEQVAAVRKLIGRG